MKKFLSITISYLARPLFHVFPLLYSGCDMKWYGQYDSTTSIDELKHKREASAEALFNTKFGDPNHSVEEAVFNSIEKELFIRANGQEEAGSYPYKHDVRHYFAFREIRDERDHSKIKQIASMAKRPDGLLYTMLPPSQVINWRDTGVGVRADRKARRACHRDELDDAGHLIGLQFGADPSTAENLADQNFIQNQAGGTWQRQERDLVRFLESHGSCRLTVEVSYATNKFGQRSLYWKMNVSDENNIWLNNLVHFSSRSHSKDRTEGYDHAKETRESLARARSGNTLPVLRVIK
jgi:hypothetical protein